MNISKLEDKSRLQPGSRLTPALVLIGLLGAVFIGIPAYVFCKKVYAWHFDQPETIQGGIELIAVFLFFALVTTLLRRALPVTAMIAGVAAIYLQVHSILLPAVLGVVFLESLIQIGGAMQRIVAIKDWQESDIRAYLAKFIAGAASWMLGALLFSAFGSGTIPFLQFYSIVLALISTFAAPSVPLCLTLVRRFESLALKDKILVLFLLLLILTQFGKANFGTDFDSVWYGARPERVLIGPHSLFDNLKLAQYVYYYPKHFETLTLSLADLNKGTFIVSFNVVLLGIGFLALYRLGRELELSRTAALLVTALAGSIPAVSNMASTAKTDNLSGIYAYLAALFFWRWCTRRGAMDFSYAFASLVGLTTTKITGYAYAPLLAIGFVPVGIWLHRTGEYSVPRGTASEPISVVDEDGCRVAPFIMAAIAFGAGGILLLRTWLLTGIPTMPAFVEFWKAFGLTPKYPWDSAQFGFIGVPIHTIKEFFDHWYRLLFNPRRYSHYVMAWPGNIGVFSACTLVILAVARSVRRSRQSAFQFACLPLMLGGILMACLLRRHGDGSTDGNYFAVPVVLTIFSVAGMLSGIRGKTRAMAAGCSLAFILFHLPVMFVSHWSWHCGTQAFHFSLQKPLVDARAEAEAELKRIGAWEIEAYLKEHPGKKLCVGFSKGEESKLHALSCIHEDFEQMGFPFAPIFSSEEGFKRYLAWAKPDLLIMPKSVSYTPDQLEFNVWMVFQELGGNRDVLRIESANYIALDISAVFRNWVPVRSMTSKMGRMEQCAAGS